MSMLSSLNIIDVLKKYNYMLYTHRKLDSEISSFCDILYKIIM